MDELPEVELTAWRDQITKEVKSEPPRKDLFDKDYVFDYIDCTNTGQLESMSYDAILCCAWDRYGDILMNEAKMTAWLNHKGCE